jgi:hypothetical protein
VATLREGYTGGREGESAMRYSASLVSELGHNPNPPSALACQLLSPAADIPLHWLWAAMCHKPTYAVQQIAEQRLVRQVTVHNEHR